MLFAFDRQRTAILLVGGDKSKDWKDWYKVNVPIADDRFDGHQARIDKARKKAAKSGGGRGKRRGGR